MRPRTHSLKTRFVGPIFSLAIMTLVMPWPLPADEPNDGPTKAALVQTLKTVLPLLESKDFAAASNHFVLPANFKPEMLDGFLSRGEVSASGIAILEADATFGTAVEVFGQERAEAFAGRAKKPVDALYGFNHTSGEATGEVLAWWDGQQFKLARLDDVGKLTAAQPATTSPTGDDGDQTEVPTPEQLATLLPALRKSVADDPNDVAARAKYARALHLLGNLPAAWEQLSEARKIEPEHKGVVLGSAVVLSALEEKGLFAVGTPDTSILKVLGEPDQKAELNKRERWGYLYMAIDFVDHRVHETIDLRNASEALFQPKEFVVVDLDGRGWTCGQRRKAQSLVSSRYFLPGQSVAKWTERVEVDRILSGRTEVGTIDNIGRVMLDQVSKRNEKSQAKIMERTDDSLIVALQVPKTDEIEAEFQLVRLMLGETDVHRLAYTVRRAQPPSAEMQEKWFRILKSATLKPVQPDESDDSVQPAE
ncbi:MAG: hypothetical protein KDA60_08045 [Planctomycetales bacterium]|nr:hypothetical protein [Planctomycetales bacterium]